MNSNFYDSNLILKTEKHVQEVTGSYESGHDWWHIFRVRNLAVKIAEKEGGNLFLIEISALLHDLDDWKFIAGPSHANSKDWLQKQQVPAEIIREIIHVIDQVSFKGAGVKTEPDSLEAKIVQDADRLDAIGAIGIDRTFSYGGSTGRPIYDPETNPEVHADFESYKNNRNPTINHFYEKLLLLKDRMNTSTAKKAAVERHRFMEVFLEEFYDEWENKK